MENLEIQEVDIFEIAHRGEEVPKAKKYRVRIDGETVTVETPEPEGETLLGRVGKRSCAFELIAEYVHHDSQVIEPNERVDLRQRGLKGFITAHKEVVTIFINNDPFPIERGEHTVVQILGIISQSPDSYVLLEEKDGPPMPMPPNLPIKICGCEVFYSQPQSGGSS